MRRIMQPVYAKCNFKLRRAILNVIPFIKFAPKLPEALLSFLFFILSAWGHTRLSFMPRPATVVNFPQLLFCGYKIHFFS